MTTRILELEVSLEIRKAIESKQININSAMAIVKKGMELMDKYKQLSGKEKKDLLIKVLENISAGNDGIIGTDDDILPPDTVASIKTILEGKLVEDIIDTIVSVARGDIDLHKIGKVTQQSATVVKGFIRFCPACIRPKVKMLTDAVAPAPSPSQAPVVTPTTVQKEVVIKTEDVNVKVEDASNQIKDTSTEKTDKKESTSGVVY